MTRGRIGIVGAAVAGIDSGAVDVPAGGSAHGLDSVAAVGVRFAAVRHRPEVTVTKGI